MSPFLRRLVGRRREIVAAIRSGTLHIWLLEDYERRSTAQAERLELVQPPTPPKKTRQRRAVQRPHDDSDDGFDCTSATVLIPEDVRHTWAAEQRLWASVLIRALYDYILYYSDPARPDKLTQQETRLGRSAKSWLESEDREVGSFVWVCSYLEVGHPDFIRRCLSNVRRKDLPRQ